jgi:hypothetical protein
MKRIEAADVEVKGIVQRQVRAGARQQKIQSRFVLTWRVLDVHESHILSTCQVEPSFPPKSPKLEFFMSTLVYIMNAVTNISIVG